MGFMGLCFLVSLSCVSQSLSSLPVCCLSSPFLFPPGRMELGDLPALWHDLCAQPTFLSTPAPPKSEQCWIILAQENSFQYQFFLLLRFTSFAEVGLEFLCLFWEHIPVSVLIQEKSAGSKRKVDKGLSKGRAAHFISIAASFSVKTWISPPCHVHFYLMLENSCSWLVWLFFLI